MPSEIKIFGGTAHPALTEAICLELKTEPGKTKLQRFADGEISLQIIDNVRGCDVFIVQPTCKPANDNLMELILMADAFKRASAKRITAVLPYFGYARQDRKDKPRVPISAKVVAKMIESAGIARVLTVDLHSAPIQGFFEIPVDHIYALPLFVEYLKENAMDHLTIVSPDVGGVVRARMLASKLNVPMAIIDKRRSHANESEVMNVIGNVSGRNCLLIDDMIDTAGTLVKGADALTNCGALSVTAMATHGIFSADAYVRILESSLKSVFVTDTIPTPPERMIKKLSIASLLASAIQSIHDKTSISTLFV